MISIGSLFVDVGMNSKELTAGAAKVGKVIDSTAQKMNEIGDNPSLDRLRAKYDPLFAAGHKYNKQLNDIRKAHALGAISTDVMTAAIKREKDAVKTSVAAIKVRGTALKKMGNDTRYAAFQQRNLAFQLNDVGISLAGGMNPLLVFIQQGSQIAQIYGPNEGGVGRALKETGKMLTSVLTKFPILTAAVVAGGAAIAGLTHEINQGSDVVVGFGDTALAVFQVIGNGIYDFIRPAIDAIAPWFSSAWDKVVSSTKTTTNFLFNAFQATFEAVVFNWKRFPTILDVSIRTAINIMISRMEFFVNSSIRLINGLVDSINAVTAKLPGTDGTAIGRVQSVSLGRVSNPNAEGLFQEQSNMRSRIGQIMSQDRVGQFFQNVRQQAINNASSEEKDSDKSKTTNRLQSRAEQIFQQTRTPQEIFIQQQDELNELLGKGMISWDTYERAIKRARDTLESALEKSKSLTNSIADSVANNIQSAESWKDLGNVAVNVIKDIVAEQIRSSTILSSTGGGIGNFFSNLFSGGISSLFGGGATAAVAHSGGIVGGPMTTRVVHPSTFANAPRFHNGGVVGRNEVPIIAQKGEGVFTKEQMRSMGGNINVTMNISTPDVQSFRKSQGQIASDMAMAVRRGQRNL